MMKVQNNNRCNYWDCAHNHYTSKINTWKLWHSSKQITLRPFRVSKTPRNHFLAFSAKHLTIKKQTCMDFKTLLIRVQQILEVIFADNLSTIKYYPKLYTITLLCAVMFLTVLLQATEYCFEISILWKVTREWVS